MLDPIVVSALVILFAQGIKWLAAQIGIPLDEQVVNALAAAIVTYLLSLFGLGLVHRAFAGAVDRGLLGSMKKS